MAYLRASAYSLESHPVVNAPKPVITISRQKGALGTTIASRTAEYLMRMHPDSQPWLVIDKGLARQVMEDHHLSQQICGFLSEEQAESVRERIQKLLAVKLPKWTAVKKMTQTMMHLAELGHIIFV